MSTPATPPTYECDLCGACCRTWRILVSDEDAAREPRIAAESKKLPANQSDSLWSFQLFPLPFRESCGFLKEDNRCDIYETRPRVCRTFTAGTDRCQEARHLNNLPPLPAKPLVV